MFPTEIVNIFAENLVITGVVPVYCEMNLATYDPY